LGKCQCPGLDGLTPTKSESEGTKSDGENDGLVVSGKHERRRKKIRWKSTPPSMGNRKKKERRRTQEPSTLRYRNKATCGEGARKINPGHPLKGGQTGRIITGWPAARPSFGWRKTMNRERAENIRDGRVLQGRHNIKKGQDS